MGPKIVVEIGANARGFATVLDQARAKISTFSRDIGRSFFGQYLGAQGFLNVLHRVGAFVTNLTRLADDLRDAAEAYGTDTTFVQRLQQDAEDAGVSFEKLKGQMTKLAEVRSKAMQGDIESRRALAEFGLSLKDIEASNPVELFRRIREQVSALGEDAAKSADLLATLAKVGFSARYMQLLRTPEGAQDVLTPGEIETLARGETAKLGAKRGVSLALSRGVVVAQSLLEKIGLKPSSGLVAQAVGWSLGGIFSPALWPKEEAKAASAPRPKRDLEADRAKALEEVKQAEMDAVKAKTKADVAAAKEARFDVSKNVRLDSLARMGGYVGNAMALPTLQRIESDQLRAQLRMERYLKALAERVGRSGWGSSFEGIGRSGWE